MQEVRSQLDELQASDAEAPKATAGGGNGGGAPEVLGPLVLPQQLRIPMKVLHDAAVAEMGAAGEVDGADGYETDAAASEDEADLDVESGALSDVDESSLVEDLDEDELVMNPKQTGGLNLSDMGRLPGMTNPPDVSASQWPLLLHALDVLLKNVRQQMDVCFRPCQLRLHRGACCKT